MLNRMIPGLIPTMLRRRVIVWCILLLLVLTLSLVACAGPTSTPVPTLNSTPASAVFQITELTINPAEVRPGEGVNITANLTNTGDTEGSYTVKLFINNVAEVVSEVTVPAGTTRVLSYSASSEIPGTYIITLGERTEQFVVVEPGKLTEPSNPKSNLAPNFTGVDVVTNETISLAQFKGTIVLLNFVNYGCSASVNQVVSAQLLAIKELREQRDDFIPLSVFCGCCPEYTLRDFAEENDLKWPWVLDTENSIVPKYIDYLREYGYPTLIFIDKDQKIREVTGYSDVSTLSVRIDEMSQ